MSFFNNVLSVGLAGVILVAGPARGTAAAQATSAAEERLDEALQSLIEANLKNNTILAPRDIDVDVKQGVVTLTGAVRTGGEKSRAASIAKVRGVSRVENKIEVDPKIDQSKLDTAAEKTKAGLTKAVDATATAAEKAKEAVVKGVGKAEQGVGKAAEKTSEAVGKAGDKVNDAAISTRVKAGLSNEALLKESAIDIDTTDHVVTLKGTVGSIAARERAGTVAGGVDGVSRVVNQLVVRAD